MSRRARLTVARKVSFYEHGELSPERGPAPPPIQRLTVMPSHHQQDRWIPASCQDSSYLTKVVSLLSDGSTDNASSCSSARLVTLCRERGIELLFLPYSLE